jgi:FkbM family methyltransferase
MFGQVTEEYFSKSGLNLSIKPHAVIVDVGGHVGMFSLQCFLRSKCTAKIFTFEPLPETRAKCIASVATADPDQKNIKVFPYGLSDKTGTVEFTYVPFASLLSGYKNNQEELDVMMNPERIVRNYYNPDSPAYWQALRVPAIFKYLPMIIGAPLLRFAIAAEGAKGPQTKKVECELRRLSDVLASEDVGPTIDVLKIDVERAELDVMRGISSADWAKVKVALIEVHENEGHLAPIRAILNANG